MKRIINLTLSSILLIAVPTLTVAQSYGNNPTRQERDKNDNKNNKRENHGNDRQTPPMPAPPIVIIAPVVVPSAPIPQMRQKQPSSNGGDYQARPHAQQPVQPSRPNYGRPGHLNPQFARGQRAPEQYRQPQYFVSDWQQRQLRRPPSGYRWVRNDNNQFLLIAIATGIIWQVFANDNNYNYQLWTNGEYLPRQYRRSNYYVNNWNYYHLRRPTNGRRWIHLHHQFLLINISNGRIYAVVDERY